MSRRLARRSAVLAVTVMAAAASLTVLTASAGAKEAPDASAREQHCAAHVTGQLPSGQFILGSIDCYATLDEARTDGATSGVASLSAGGGVSALSGDVILATHFDGLYLTGSSFSVWGPGCDANGWINMAPAWNNKISSTVGDCAVWHFDGFNLSGSWEYLTAPGGNLSGLNNRTSSARYTN